MAHIKRRLLLFAAGAAAGSAALGALAQVDRRPAHIAFIALTTQTGLPTYAAFKEGLRELGHVEGKNLVIDEYWAGGDHDRLSRLAAEAVRKNPAVIVAVATPAIRVVQQQTKTIPIVMSPATDPVGSGFVKTLAAPGGNITGVGNLVIDLSAKTIALIRELLPQANRVVVLRTRNPTHPAQVKEIEEAAKARGIAASSLTATSPQEVVHAFESLRQVRPSALVVLGDPFLFSQRTQIAELAAGQKIAAVYQLREHVDAGGLISYGPKLRDLFKRAAFYVDRILKGAKPSELPVELPMTFELTLNKAAANALGIRVSRELLLQADRVIE